jgi:transposase-like protein
MKLIDVTKKFATEDQCLDYIEKMRWPDGEIGCTHCGEIGRITKVTRRSQSKNKRTRLYQCGACKKQFSPTSGTIFNDTHLPLTKWFMAMAMICEAKKGMSACQLQRHLGVNYRTAWHLCHRIREAMQDEMGLLTGVVEADETYLRPRKIRKGHPKPIKQEPYVVLGMMERGGRLRLVPVADSKMKIIEPVIKKHISSEALLQTDAAVIYDIIGGRNFKNRRMVDHIQTYGMGENHTNNVENAFSLLKRGVYGTFHKVSYKHLFRYCNEFSYRFNRRGMQLEMFDETLRHLSRGQVLPYKVLTAPLPEAV